MTYSDNTHILSIDVGTSSVRSRVYDAKGMALGGVGEQIPYTMQHTADGGSFIDAELLCGYIERVIGTAAQQAQQNDLAIQAVSICTFWHNVLGVDDAGRACTPLLNWSDTRPEAVLASLKQRLDPTEFTQRTGCPFHAAYLPFKIAWLHQAMPQQAQRAVYWMSIGEYLFYKLFGSRQCTYSMASGSGLLDSARLRWDEITVEAVPAQMEQFSPLVNGSEGLTNLREDYQSRWPVLRHAVWFPAYGDGACSNVGCGAVSPEALAIMVGTSGAMRIVWRGEYRPPAKGLWCYRIDSQRVVQGGALSNGGNLIAWMRQTLQLPEPQALEAQLHKAAPDSHGLTLLPFWAGQRSPRWNPNSIGTIHGLRQSTTPAQILQAAMEAVAYRFRLIHERLQAHGAEDHVLIATGGGLLNSAAWTQMMADVLGRPLQLSNIEEASCRGTALLALESLGLLPDITRQNKMLGPVYSPQTHAHEIYNQGFQRHVDFEMQNQGR